MIPLILILKQMITLNRLVQALNIFLCKVSKIKILS
jgi:hypothetical protein